MPEEDIMFDPLVFPGAQGTKTIWISSRNHEGVRLIKETLPRTKTILGISNVLWPPSRGPGSLNSVFLYHCVQAGLDMAIVNSELLQRYNSIPEYERTLAENLIWYRGDDPVAGSRITSGIKPPRPQRRPPKHAT
ncbi:MAG: hypothetical protein CM1200mP35_09660 [Chloroflexota bacterium]|nr:MAG: hypothetical protein CM1200mP35_09660 [Chloroflexota bacterium]